jgi:hypothetical protein
MINNTYVLEGIGKGKLKNNIIICVLYELSKIQPMKILDGYEISIIGRLLVIS